MFFYTTIMFLIINICYINFSYSSSSNKSSKTGKKNTDKNIPAKTGNKMTVKTGGAKKGKKMTVKTGAAKKGKNTVKNTISETNVIDKNIIDQSTEVYSKEELNSIQQINDSICNILSMIKERHTINDNNIIYIVKVTKDCIQHYSDENKNTSITFDEKYNIIRCQAKNKKNINTNLQSFINFLKKDSNIKDCIKNNLVVRCYYESWYYFNKINNNYKILYNFKEVKTGTRALNALNADSFKAKNISYRFILEDLNALYINIQDILNNNEKLKTNFTMFEKISQLLNKLPKDTKRITEIKLYIIKIHKTLIDTIEDINRKIPNKQLTEQMEKEKEILLKSRYVDFWNLHKENTLTQQRQVFHKWKNTAKSTILFNKISCLYIKCIRKKFNEYKNRTKEDFLQKAIVEGFLCYNNPITYGHKKITYGFPNLVGDANSEVFVKLTSTLYLGCYFVEYYYCKSKYYDSKNKKRIFTQFAIKFLTKKSENITTILKNLINKKYWHLTDDVISLLKENIENIKYQAICKSMLEENHKYVDRKLYENKERILDFINSEEQ